MSTEDNSISRRFFIKAAATSVLGVAGAGFGIFKFLSSPSKRIYPGAILGASSKAGHLLRGTLPGAPTETETVGTIIVGSGIAALSAGWWLKKNGDHDFVILELEDHVGGNSHSGKNQTSAYPWGAHYLPLPGPDAVYVTELLQELKVINGQDAKGLPIYDEFFLCADPHERLFLQGRWQEGLVPQLGLTTEDRRQYHEFFSMMEEYKIAVGSDGRRAFTIPIDLSSKDRRYTDLDQISMADFMKSKGWDSRYLNWYANYCTRDDYGATYDKVSAWAGIHYFASRNGKGANADAQAVLTWPEGNGWLVNKLRERVGNRVQTSSLVYAVNDLGGEVHVDSMNVNTRQTKRYLGKNVIFAAPRFVAAHVVQDLATARPAYLKNLQYAPWMVANVSVKSHPQGPGAPLSWDNVSYYGNSLGYVVATHQDLKMRPGKTVLTYYLPLSGASPADSRQRAIERSHAEWARDIAADLERMHPGINDEIENIDVWLWGHGMIIPQIGFITGRDRQQMLKSSGNVHYAHSDMSGVSIFEEAQYHGVEAAKKVLARATRLKAVARAGREREAT